MIPFVFSMLKLFRGFMDVAAPSHNGHRIDPKVSKTEQTDKGTEHRMWTVPAWATIHKMEPVSIAAFQPSGIRLTSLQVFSIPATTVGASGSELL